MIISFYYYLRIIKAMFMDANDRPIPKLETSFSPKASLFICVAGIVVTGLASGVMHIFIHC